MAISEVTTIEELASAPYTDDDDGGEVSAYMQELRDKWERIERLRDTLKSVSGLRTELRFRTSFEGYAMNDRKAASLHKMHEHWYVALDTAMAEAERCIMGMISLRENF